MIYDFNENVAEMGNPLVLGVFYLPALVSSSFSYQITATANVIDLIDRFRKSRLPSALHPTHVGVNKQWSITSAVAVIHSNSKEVSLHQQNLGLRLVSWQH